MILTDHLPNLKTFLRPLALSAASYPLVARFLAAFLFHPQDPSPAAAAHLDRCQQRHRATLARFLADVRLSPDCLRCLQVATLLLAREAQVRGTWLLILDQTYCTRLGVYAENTFARGNHQKRPTRSGRHQKKHARCSCHCFVMALLLTPSGLRLPLFKSFYTREHCAELQRPFFTQTALAAQLIGAAAVPAGCPVTVLGDTAFEAQSIRSACAQQGYQWIVPLNPERVLEGPKPRPKVRSLVDRLVAEDLTPYRLQAWTGEFVAQRRLSRPRRSPATPARVFYTHSRRATVHSVGEVRLVFSTMQAPTSGEKVRIQKILMTNAVAWSAERIVEVYDLRWQIELFFKECKSGLGLSHYRLRHFNRVQRWVTLCLVAFTYLEWLRLRQQQGKERWGPEAEWWQGQRTHGIREALRTHREEAQWQQCWRWSQTKTGLRKLKHYLRQARPPEKEVGKGVKKNKLC
jgi:Transposase DDE domain